METPTINEQLVGMIAASGCSLFVSANSHGIQWHAIETDAKGMQIVQRGGKGDTPELAIAACKADEFMPTPTRTK